MALPKRIALVRYQPAYFSDFGLALEEHGFQVFWINSSRSHTRQLIDRIGLPDERVLDTTRGFIPKRIPLADCRRELSKLEGGDGPRINDIILMDRLLRKKPHDFALRYLYHLQQQLTQFLSDHSITLVSSGRDTALQLMSLLVCRRLNIPWIVPTRIRIPKDLYGFCRTHQTDQMLKVREVSDDDRTWAYEFLSQFRGEQIRPAIHKSARTFADVLRLLPDHWRAFQDELRMSFADRGNDYSRYALSDLVRMYVRRRINLLSYVLRPPYAGLGSTPYCLYALHTQPESSVDVMGAYFSDQIALITFIARSLPSSHELYVKVHPADVDGKPGRFYRSLARIPGVRLVSHEVDSRALLQRADVVFTLTGTIGYEASLLGKPVITFGRNFFNVFPSVHYCDAPPDLPRLIDSLLASGPGEDSDARTIEALAGLRAKCFVGEVNRSYGVETSELTSADLERLQCAYEVVHEILNGGVRDSVRGT